MSNEQTPEEQAKNVWEKYKQLESESQKEIHLHHHYPDSWAAAFKAFISEASMIMALVLIMLYVGHCSSCIDASTFVPWSH